MSNRSWIADRFLALFPNADLAAGGALVSKRRVLDFSLGDGIVSARVQEESGKTLRIELRLSSFDDTQWDRIFTELAKTSLPYAALLSGEYPEEVETALQREGLGLVSTSVPESDLYSSPRFGALLLKLAERLETDPFAVFTIRGRGREETLSELKLRQRPGAGSIPAQPREKASMTAREFFGARLDLKSFSYRIRADELPAALLKRLDQVPESSFESEMRLEEAYAQVARRAQVYGLGMRKSGESEG